MILDWHLTCLSYATHYTNITVMGEEKFTQVNSQTFYAPFQYPKEVHKNIKLINNEYLEKNTAFSSGNGQLTLADFFIFHEILTLNIIGHNLSKYPKVVLYLQRLNKNHPAMGQSTKFLQAQLERSGGKFYLSNGFGQTANKL